ncbi:MAG: plastocyanin/azurin family copper-binding protein [Gemmatimonadota bacterium]
MKLGSRSRGRWASGAWSTSIALACTVGGFYACDRGQVMAPPPPSVSVIASPTSGPPPLAVDLVISVTGARESVVTYRIDCAGDGDFELEVRTSANPFSAGAICTYSELGTFFLTVQAGSAERFGEGGAQITVTPPPPPPPPSPAAGDSVVVSMQDDFFQAVDVTVKPGTRVIWRNEGQRPHTSTSDTGVWDSGTLNPGQSLSWTVPAEAALGTAFPYHCVFHGAPGGIGMAGVVRVDTVAPPPPPPAAIVTTPGLSFSPEEVEIRPGESVLWKFSGATHNVTFEDERPPGGDIPDSPPGSEALRTFPAPGDYDYECTLHKGQKGRVRVRSG